MQPAFISLCFRSPFGSLGGALSTFDPVFLSSIMIQNLAAIDEIFELEDIDHYILGNALDANFGANLIHRVVQKSALPNNIPRTQIHQGLLTGFKVLEVALSFLAPTNRIILCQTVEQMSSQPDYIPNKRMRNGASISDVPTVDGLMRDGYYNDPPNRLTPFISEETGQQYGLDLTQCNAWANYSANQYLQAFESKEIQKEISPIVFPGNEGAVRYMYRDQESTRYHTKQIDTLTPTMGEAGMLTNASIAGSADGSAIMIVADEKGLMRSGLIPLVRVVAYDQSYSSGGDYIKAGVQSIHNCLTKAQLSIDDIDIIEIHEDTAVTPMILKQLVGIEQPINRYGGSLAIGNPLSVTGQRLISTVCNQLRSTGGKYGLAHMTDPSGMSGTVIFERT